MVQTVVAPHDGKTIVAGGIRTHYLDIGVGAPLLLLHGSGPGVSAWANWQSNVGALAEQHRVLAPDLVGFGDTERPDDIHYSLQTWTDHVWAFLDALDIERVSVVGNSLGGRIAIELARRPERLDRMVLMGSPSVGMKPTEGLSALREYAPSEENMRALLRNWMVADPALITDELVRTRYRASIAPGAFEAYRGMFFSPHHAGTQLAMTEEQVRAISTPTLILHGRDDKVVPVEMAWSMVHLLADADLMVFSKCGHWAQIERCSDFNGVVAGFLGRGQR